jgi:antitoxin component of RelBE/YafQ-DinJ toxin-antitoxin module
MNTAALTIRTTPDTKKMITRFAESVGLSTSAFATAILTQAVRDQKVVLTPVIEPTEFLEDIMNRTKQDRISGQNFVSADSEQEMDAIFGTS